MTTATSVPGPDEFIERVRERVALRFPHDRPEVVIRTLIPFSASMRASPQTAPRHYMVHVSIRRGRTEYHAQMAIRHSDLHMVGIHRLLADDLVRLLKKEVPR